MPSIVDSLKTEHDGLLAFLVESQPSFANVMEGTLAKVLLLAAASELEVRFQDVLLDFYTEVVQEHVIAVEFVRNKAVKRQYHTYFDWNSANANQFFGLFGQDFKKAIAGVLKERDDLADAIAAFIEVGSLRNQLVHQNYAVFVLPKTADEIYDRYCKAVSFVTELPALLREFSNAGPEGAAA